MQQSITQASSLLSLLDVMKNTNHNDTEAAFDHLSSLVGPNIRIRYEILKSPEEPAKADSDDEFAEAAKPVRKSRFGHLNNLVVRRVLLTSDRNHADFNSQLVRECNGVVLEYPTWKVLSVPSLMFNPRFKLAQIVSNLSKYTVTYINDGTTVTLYWDSASSKWCVASSNGFEVNNYKWIGEATYESAIHEVATSCNFSFDSLDKNRCYTIGFRHHDFHPLRTDPQRLWFVQSVNLNSVNEGKSCKPEFTTDCGIPMQTEVAFPLDGSKPIDWMLSKNAESLTRYFTTTKRGGDSTVPEIHYGFVLRGDNGANSGVVLESSLLKRVRRLMYNLPKNRYTNVVPETSEERLEYNILRAYLGYDTKYNFINLFPQFTPQYKKYDKLFNSVVSTIFNALRNRNVRANLVAKSQQGKLDSKVDILALQFIPYIEKDVPINTFDSQVSGVIQDFITDPNYIDLYYTCLIKNH
jgi:hypothetical protein